ncbi:MAG: cupin domain-containing protein [Dehalococcoidia bacterium]
MSTDEQFTVIDTTAVEWEDSFNPRLGVALGRLMLRKDPGTGAEIRMIRYPKGIVNPAHTHPCGHGIFVLTGTLRTHRGDFGPGTWVWFPKGEVMEHGATEEGDVTGIFITDGEFDIYYRD